MEKNNVHITGCKIGKAVSVDYTNHLDSRNYNVTDDEIPHPDMRKALLDLQEDLASAYWAMSGVVTDNFVPTGFTVTEKDGEFSITISGKMETKHGDTVNVSSGKISLDDDPDLSVKLETLRNELYDYLFKGKSAQTKIEFKDEEK